MSASIFNADTIKILKDKLQFKAGGKITSEGSVDPTAIATEGRVGDIYINTTSGLVYIKLVAGPNTNWVKIITSDIDQVLNSPIISNVVPVSPVTGNMWMNSALNVKVPGGTLQVGEEMYSEVINKTGVQINNGTFIYTSGANSGYPQAVLARANSFATHAAVAMTTNDIAIDGVAKVTISGIVHDIPTNVDSEGHAVTAGQEIWLSATVAGGWTNVEPYAPYFSIKLGKVLVADATVGQVLVDIQHNNARDMAIVDKSGTGFDVPSDVIVTYDSANQTISITGTGWKAYWRGKEVVELPSGTVPVAHPNVLGHTYFLYWDGTGINNGFNWATDSFPGFDKLLIAYVYYYTNDKFGIRECHGLVMSPDDHQEFHEVNGTYRTSGGVLTAGTYTTFPALNLNTMTSTTQNTWGADSIVLRDEDLPTTNPAWIQDTYTTAYRSGAAGDWVFNTAATVPYFFGAGTNFVQYNQNTGATWQLTDVTEVNFVNYYLFSIPVTADANSQKYRLIVIPGQSISTTLAAAQAVTTLNLALGNLYNIFTESFPYVRNTLYKRSSGGAAAPVGIVGRCGIVDVAYNTGTSRTLLLAAGATPGDHSNLSGRSTLDSHPASAINGTTTGSVIFSGTTGLAEDNANFFWDNTSKRLGIGNATPTVKLQISGIDGEAAVIAERFSNDANWPTLAMRKSRGVVVGDLAATSLEDTLGLINFSGVTTLAAYQSAASIRAIQDVAATTVMNGRLSFFVTSAGTAVERLRISSNGNVGVNMGSTAPTSTLQVNATAIVGTEALFKCTVSDDATGYYTITNGTSGANTFSPTTWSNCNSSTVLAQQQVSSTIDGGDTGAIPMVIYNVRRFPSNTVIVNRPLFRWSNFTTEIMSIAATGSVSMVAGVASTNTTTGTVVITGGLGISGKINGALFPVFSDVANGIQLSGGTTAQRTGSPVAGMIRYNTTLATFESYQNAVWVAQPYAATLVTAVGSNTLFTPPTSTVEYEARIYISDNGIYGSAKIMAVLKNTVWEYTVIGGVNTVNIPGTFDVNTSTGVLTYTAIAIGVAKIKSDYINF